MISLSCPASLPSKEKEAFCFVPEGCSCVKHVFLAGTSSFRFERSLKTQLGQSGDEAARSEMHLGEAVGAAFDAFHASPFDVNFDVQD